MLVLKAQSILQWLKFCWLLVVTKNKRVLLRCSFMKSRIKILFIFTLIFRQNFDSLKSSFFIDFKSSKFNWTCWIFALKVFFNFSVCFYVIFKNYHNLGQHFFLIQTWKWKIKSIEKEFINSHWIVFIISNQFNQIHHGKRSGIAVLGSGRGQIKKNDIYCNAEAGVYVLYGGNPTVRSVSFDLFSFIFI